ncbi:MAG: response regulator [Gemmatimonadota bacterium]|nr:response regulator [Gemmatimonadota bacterium]
MGISAELMPLEKALSVLVVDDDLGVSSSYRKVLERSGFVVEVVSNGVDAFDVLQNEEVRAIVCDLNMPLLDGSHFFEQLEERIPEMASRVIFVTGDTEDAKMSKFLKRTGQPFLQKPAEIAELVEYVTRMARRL